MFLYDRTCYHSLTYTFVFFFLSSSSNIRKTCTTVTIRSPQNPTLDQTPLNRTRTNISVIHIQHYLVSSSFYTRLHLSPDFIFGWYLHPRLTYSLLFQRFPFRRILFLRVQTKVPLGRSETVDEVGGRAGTFDLKFYFCETKINVNKQIRIF